MVNIAAITPKISVHGMNVNTPEDPRFSVILPPHVEVIMEAFTIN
jgi:hypothetical protein